VGELSFVAVAGGCRKMFFRRREGGFTTVGVEVNEGKKLRPAKSRKKALRWDRRKGKSCSPRGKRTTRLDGKIA